MRELLRDFWVLRKAGFTRSGERFIVFFIILAVVMFILGGLSIIPQFAVLLDFLVLLFIPIAVTSSVALGKYRLLYSMPIKAENIVKQIYLNSYLTIIVSIIVTTISYSFVSGVAIISIQLIKVVVALAFTNWYVPTSVAPEMNYEYMQGKKNSPLIILSTFIGVMFGLTSIIITKQDLMNLLISTGSSVWTTVAGLIILILCVCTFKYSVKKSLTIVRM